MQCDKHIPKMVVEAAQMLSTAHRMLDGVKTKQKSKSGKRFVATYNLEHNAILDSTLYKAVHYNHPCTVWTMESDANYMWHYNHFIALCDEYQYRYGRVHATDEKLRYVLMNLPKNIPMLGYQTPFKLAMGSNPECMDRSDPVGSYRKFYMTKQERFPMVWTRREVPSWFQVLEEAA